MEAIREGATSGFERRLGSQHLNRNACQTETSHGLVTAVTSRLRDSRKIVDGVRQLEGPFCVATFQVALLIPEAEDNRVSLFGNLAPFWRLEVHGARKMSAHG